MAKVGVSIYSLRVLDCDEKDKSKKFKNLNKITEDKSFLELMVDLFKGSDKYKNLKKEERLFKIENNGIIKTFCKDGIELYKYVTIKVSSGKYGDVSDFIEIKSNKKKYRRTINDAEVMNFYFQIAIPLGKASTRGIILFENISGKGIKTIIQNEINEYIRNDLNLNLGISIKPLATKEYIERLFEKINIKKITFMGFAKDNNNDSALDEDRGVRSFKSSEYTLKSPVIPNIGAKLKKCVNDSKEISKIVEFDDFKYDNIKIDIRNDRNNRTIDLSKLSEVLMYEDITEKVFLLQQINESELLKELSSLCYYYLKEMRLIR